MDKIEVPAERLTCPMPCSLVGANLAAMPNYLTVIKECAFNAECRPRAGYRPRLESGQGAFPAGLRSGFHRFFVIRTIVFHNL